MVQTSSVIACQSTFAYLFSLDFKAREMFWLNTGFDSYDTERIMALMTG